MQHAGPCMSLCSQEMCRKIMSGLTWWPSWGRQPKTATSVAVQAEGEKWQAARILTRHSYHGSVQCIQQPPVFSGDVSQDCVAVTWRPSGGRVPQTFSFLGYNFELGGEVILFLLLGTETKTLSSVEQMWMAETRRQLCIGPRFRIRAANDPSVCTIT